MPSSHAKPHNTDNITQLLNFRTKAVPAPFPSLYIISKYHLTIYLSAVFNNVSNSVSSLPKLTQDNRTPLYLAAYYGDVECVSALLQAGAAINFTSNVGYHGSQIPIDVALSENMLVICISYTLSHTSRRIDTLRCISRPKSTTLKLSKY